MKLHEVTGIVTNIRTATSVSGSIRKGKGTVSSTEILNFTIDKQAVTYSGGETANISEGDRVCAVGKQGRNGLNAMAYYNYANNTYGDNGAWIRWVGVFFFCITAIMIFLIPVDPVGIILAIIFSIPAIILYKTGNDRHKALKICLQRR